MRLIKLVFWLVALAAIVWFGTTVQLGRRTLFGHLYAIFTTPEAKELGRATADEARRVADRVQSEMHRDGGTRAAPEHIDDGDRRALDKLVRERGPKEHRP